MHVFYSPNASLGIFTLGPEESKHCLRVLRKRNGDLIDVVDGKGTLFHSEITDDGGKLCELKAISFEKEYDKRNYKVGIAIALPKNTERFKWFLEKSTEIGIDNIHPIIAERAERRTVNMDRSQKILISAMKQSVKAYLPILHEPRKFSEIMTEDNIQGRQRFVATCGMEKLPHLKDVCQKERDGVVLIGPEGDFTEEEMQLAIANGFQPVSLGKSRLRVETAGVLACYTINLLNE